MTNEKNLMNEQELDQVIGGQKAFTVVKQKDNTYTIYGNDSGISDEEFLKQYNQTGQAQKTSSIFTMAGITEENLNAAIKYVNSIGYDKRI